MRHCLCALATASLLFGLPLAAEDAGDVVLRDGFDGSGFSDDGGLYYRENFEQEAGIVEFQSTTVRNGRGALKLSVAKHCPDDLAGCSERAEIWEETALRVPYDRGVWYGFALRFDQPIPQKAHRYVVAQWKREIKGADGDFSPFLALRMKSGRLFATVETRLAEPADPSIVPVNGTCPDGLTPVWLRPETNQMRALVATDGKWGNGDGAEFTACTERIRVTRYGTPLPTPDSGWIDFAVYTRPGPDGDGRIEIFANDARIVTVEGMIGHAAPGLGENQYFKFGPYRDADPGLWTLFYDDFRRSPSCKDVLADVEACPAP